MNWLSDLIGSSASEIIKSVGEVADRFITTEEEKLAWETKKSELDLNFKKLGFEIEKAYLVDKESARDMYKKDSSLQKAFAIVFLLGYILLSGFIIYIMLDGTFTSMNNWETGFISSVFTAMSTKVNTIVDFLFGGSHSKEESHILKSINKK